MQGGTGLCGGQNEETRLIWFGRCTDVPVRRCGRLLEQELGEVEVCQKRTGCVEGWGR